MLIPDYDAADAAPDSELIASAYRDVISEVPWTVEFHCDLDPSALHPSAGGRKFVRTAALVSNLDIKTYDGGNLHVATVDGSAISWGKLWVEYDVEFFVPQLPPTGVAASFKSARINGVSPSQTSYFGTTPTVTGDTSDFTATGNTLTFVSSGSYLVVMNLVGTGTSVATSPSTASSTATVTLINHYVNSTTGASYQYLVTADAGETLSVAFGALQTTTISASTCYIAAYDAT